MKSKTILLFLFILFLVPIAYSSNSVFWIDPLEEKTLFGDTTFVADIDNTWATVVTYIDGKPMIIDIGTCEKKIPYVVCYLENEFNVSFSNEGYTNTARKPSIKFNVTELRPDIEFTRTVQSSTLEINENNNVNIKLENTGDREAEVKLVEVIPSSFDITNIADSVKVEGNKIIWEGIIQRGDTREIYYNYEVKEQGSFKTNATLNYTGDGYSYGSTSSYTEKVVGVYEIEVGYENSTYPGGKIDYNLSLKNIKEGKSIRVTGLKLILPESFDVVAHSNGFKKENNNSYKRQWSLEEGETEKSNFTLMPKYSGRYTIGYDFTGMIGGVRYTKNEENIVDVVLNKPSVTMQIKDYDDMNATKIKQETNIILEINNINENVDFFDLKCNLTRDGKLIRIFTSNSLLKGEKKRLTVYNFKSNYVNDIYYFDFDIRCTAKTKYGEEIMGENNSIIAVIPFDNSTTIKPLSSYEITADDVMYSALEGEKVEEEEELIEENIDSETGDLPVKENSNVVREDFKQEKKNIFRAVLDFFKSLF